MPRLLVVEGPLKGRQFEVGPGGTMGRGEACTVRVEGRHISRVHCKFEQRGEQLAIVDNDSRNGIFVNGHKVKEQLLAKDDELEVGEHVLVFEPSYEMPGDPTPPASTVAGEGKKDRPTERHTFKALDPAAAATGLEPPTQNPGSARAAPSTAIVETMGD